MNDYLQKHPELNLNDLFDFWYMDQMTSPDDVFGGLLCKLALERGGLELLKKLMSYGKKDENFYEAIEEMFGIRREDLNEFLRTKIAEYANQ